MSKETRFTGTDTYVASDDLMASVEVATKLQKPLLIKGEPGLFGILNQQLKLRMVCIYTIQFSVCTTASLV